MGLFQLLVLIAVCVAVLGLVVVPAVRWRVFVAKDASKPAWAAAVSVLEALQIVAIAALVSAALTWLVLLYLTSGEGTTAADVAATIARLRSMDEFVGRTRLAIWVWAFVAASLALLGWVWRRRRGQFAKARAAILQKQFDDLVEQFNRGELPPREPTPEMAKTIAAIQAVDSRIEAIVGDEDGKTASALSDDAVQRLRDLKADRQSLFHHLVTQDIMRRIEVPAHDPDVVGTPRPARSLMQKIVRIFVSRGMFRQMSLGQRALLVLSVLLLVPSLVTFSGGSIAATLAARITGLDQVRVALTAKEAEGRFQEAARKAAEDTAQASPDDQVDDQTFVHIAYAHARAFEGAFVRNLERRFAVAPDPGGPPLRETKAALRRQAAREHILAGAAHRISDASPPHSPGPPDGTKPPDPSAPSPTALRTDPPTGDPPAPHREVQVHGLPPSGPDSPPTGAVADRMARTNPADLLVTDTPSGKILAEETVTRGRTDRGFRARIVKSFKALGPSFFEMARPSQLRGIMLAAALGGSAETAVVTDVVTEPMAHWAETVVSPAARARTYEINSRVYMETLLRTGDAKAAVKAVENAPVSTFTDIEAAAVRANLVPKISPDGEIVEATRRYPASLVETLDGVGDEAARSRAVTRFYENEVARRALRLPADRVAELAASAPVRGSYEGFFPATERSAARSTVLGEAAAAKGEQAVARAGVAAVARARSFTLLRGFSRVGGVLIGQEPQPGKLDVRRLDWTLDRENLTLTIGFADGHSAKVGPFHASVANLALGYAADGRVLTATMTKADPLTELRILLHPILVDTPLGCRAIEIDRYVDESSSESNARERQSILLHIQSWLYAVARTQLVNAVFDADNAKILARSDEELVSQAESMAATPATEVDTSKSVFDAAFRDPALILSPQYSPLKSKSRYYSTRIVKLMEDCLTPNRSFADFHDCVAKRAKAIALSDAEELKSKENINWTAPTPKFEIWSGVRERPYTLDPALSFAGAAPAEPPPAPFDFIIQVSFTSPPYGDLKTPWFEEQDTDLKDDSEPWKFPEAGLETTKHVLKLVKSDREKENTVGGMREFVWLQRLFRAGLAGNLGSDFPVERLTELGMVTAPFVKRQRTMRWNVRTPPELSLLKATTEFVKTAGSGNRAAAACLQAVGIDAAAVDSANNATLIRAVLQAQSKLYKIDDDAWDHVCRFDNRSGVTRSLIDDSGRASDLRRLRHAFGLREDEKLATVGVHCGAL